MKLINVSHETGTKKYKTAAGAIKAIEKLEDKCGENFTVIMAARDDGLFAPVILIKENQMWRIGALIHAGFYVCRT